ncbi:hypothetical protein E2562_015354 [Oryza meyeriana var. granulata]|uniref:Trichome birefringence-like C-terminal domain-containing protein n=1 Tax=Oryza meyeriana var. granulata TaxID=110450 RepID=A0A6G1ELV7_9ORYZ|nr:hypothetical protein E2562_015354 [Oryza meyeriana var. granulata]
MANASHVYRYEPHAFTVADPAFWSPFLVRAVETDPDGRDGQRIRPVEPPPRRTSRTPEWAAHVGRFDYVVVSAGSWFYLPSMF